MNEKAHFIDRVSREMEADLQVPSLSAPEALAAACRILAREGHESGLAGQVTARAEKPGAWWTLQFGYGFEEATPERMWKAGNIGGELLNWIVTLGVVGKEKPRYLADHDEKDGHAYAAWRWN